METMLKAIPRCRYLQKGKGLPQKLSDTPHFIVGKKRKS
jgi:hypothetical protein